MPVSRKTGRIALLRVHELGSGYGPPNQNLDVEVIIRFENDDGRAYGFQLRNDQNLPVTQAMFALLRDAFNSDEVVTIEYYDETPSMTLYRVCRVWRER